MAQESNDNSFTAPVRQQKSQKEMTMAMGHTASLAQIDVTKPLSLEEQALIVQSKQGKTANQAPLYSGSSDTYANYYPGKYYTPPIQAKTETAQPEEKKEDPDKVYAKNIIRDSKGDYKLMGLVLSKCAKTSPKIVLYALEEVKYSKEDDLALNVSKNLTDDDLMVIDLNLLVDLKDRIDDITMSAPIAVLTSDFWEVERLRKIINKRKNQKEGEGEEKSPAQEPVNETNTTTPVVGGGETLPLTLGLTGDVGLGVVEPKAADVLLVKNKLIEYGFLTSGQTSDAQLYDAIGEFQKTIPVTPDKLISKGGATERALATGYTAIKSDSDFKAIKDVIKDDFTITTSKQADGDFATKIKGKTINSASTAQTIDLNALIALRKRLNDFYATLDNKDLIPLINIKKEDLTEAQKKTINDAIKASTEALKKFQVKKEIEWWSNKKKYGEANIYILTQSATKASFENGGITDGDATFIYLHEYKKYTYSWDKESGDKKTATANNFVKSGYSAYTEGVSIVGTVDPEDVSSEDFQSAMGVGESRAKALKAASKHEGNFDGINTYDKVKFSFGLIQFTQASSLLGMLAKLKIAHPATFQDLLGKYGVDIEFRTNKNNKVDNSLCRLVIHDAASKQTFRGDEAIEIVRKDPVYAAILMKSAEHKDMKDIQLKQAKEMYMDNSENVKVGKKIKALIVSKDGIGGAQTYTKEKEITKYKNTGDYTTNNSNGHITEIDLDLTNLKLGDVMQSEKERAALYGVYINAPVKSSEVFRETIIELVIEKKLTTIEQVKNIDPIDLLKKAKDKFVIPIRINRVQDAIDSEDLN